MTTPSASGASDISVSTAVRLVRAMQEFDPTDDYHFVDLHEPGYYAAIERCIALVQGDITDWTSPRAKPDCPACGHPDGQHDEAGCLWPQWADTPGVPTCSCARSSTTGPSGKPDYPTSEEPS